MKRLPLLSSVLRRPSSVFCLLSSVLCLPSSASAAEPAAEPAAIFAYDKSAPFNLQETGRETRGAALVRDLTFTPADKPV